jgi:tetratricopeptide (TPR) repeat protein
MSIESRFRRSIFAACCILGAISYLSLAFRSYLASHLASDPTERNLQRAIGLEPSNAEYRDDLGQLLMYAGRDPKLAISQYDAAVHLNPHAARYWLDLANAYMVADRTNEQRESLERAVLVDPTAPHVAWEAANFFFVQGDREQALHNVRPVLANDPELVEQALQLCWRASGNANEILDQAVPKRADLYFSFIHVLIEKKETAAAKTVWNRLVKLHEPFPVQLSFPYLRFLLAQRDVAGAQDTWRQLASVSQTLAPYLPSPASLIVNGGFEEKMLDGGFDWQYSATPHVDLAIDTNEFYSGTRSLSITFDGQNPADAGIFQFIPVKPNTQYEFTAAYRTEELVTASGPRFSVADAYTNASYVLSDDLMGTYPWRMERAQFRTGPDTNLLVLRITRQPAGPLIKGKLWIDDLKLVEK